MEVLIVTRIKKIRADDTLLQVETNLSSEASFIRDGFKCRQRKLRILRERLENGLHFLRNAKGTKFVVH